jgi:hypothetical protein
MPVKADKDLKLYYSIGEVAEMFGVNDTLLRFWEREFPQISPKKGARGIRQYTKRDIETVRVVYNLVKVRGLRIEAAREALRNNYNATASATEVVDRLRAIREELVSIREELRQFAVNPCLFAPLPPLISPRWAEAGAPFLNTISYGQSKNRLRLRRVRIRHTEMGGQMPLVRQLEHDEGIYRRSVLAFARRRRGAAGRIAPRHAASCATFAN